jgi:hypothetical protein
MERDPNRIESLSEVRVGPPGRMELKSYNRAILIK